jgi:inosine-uridine nucleoside N-ribohydrolase
MTAGDEARLFDALRAPNRKVAMVLDTDTFNEIDDQFALAYAMRSPVELDVKAIYAAPFHNHRSSGPRDGMEQSYEEILRLLDRMGVRSEGFVFRGADRYLASQDAPVASPAVDDMIARSLDHHSADRLYVVAIGAITNVASALLTDPSMKDRVVVVWLGGHALYWPHTREFNLIQDLAAANVVFSSGVPLVQVPCLPVASHTLTSLSELERDMGRANELCAFLIDRFAAYSETHFAYSKELWDIAPIGWLVNADWAPSHLDHSPVVQSDYRYSIDRRRHLIRVVDGVHRNAIFADMFRKLSGAVQT